MKKELLEEAVIEAVIDLYKPFIGDDAQDRMADVLDEQIGSDITEIAKTQASIKSQVRKIDRKVRNLLDNITARNKNLADVRLSELTQEREQLEDQLESFENLAITEEECQELITETAGFIASQTAHDLWRFTDHADRNHHDSGAFRLLIWLQILTQDKPQKAAHKR